MSDLGAITRTATLARVPGTADTRARAHRPSVSDDTRTDVAPSLSAFTIPSQTRSHYI